MPTSFNEKLQYKLIHDRRPIGRTYADKLAVRDYVEAQCPGLRLPRLLGVFAREDQVMRGIPPAPWVMKASHGSAMVLVCDRPAAISADEIYRCARQWLRTDYAVRYWERQYLGLPRRIMFEEFLSDDGHTPDDYKFYVIHQKVAFIVVDQGRFGQHTRNCFWPDWTPIESRIGRFPFADVVPARPAALGRMLEVAERLACDTDVARIDLYYVRGEVYFGEITHSPAAGGLIFADRVLDEKIGSLWELPKAYADLPLRPALPVMPAGERVAAIESAGSPRRR